VRNSLVVAEVALSLILLIGAGLLLNSFVRLISVDPGFRPDQVLTMRISVPEYSYPTGRQVAAFFQQVVDQVERVRGVEYVGVSNFLPLGRGVVHTAFVIPGGLAPTAGEADSHVGPLYFVSPQYLNALSTPIVDGRGLTERDNQRDAEPVVLINRAFAGRYFPNENPLGKHVRLSNYDLTCAIVGVIDDMKNGGLGDDQLWLGKPAWATLYLPHALMPATKYDPPWSLGRSMYLVVRTVSAPLGFTEAVRRAVWAVDPAQPIADIKTLNERVMDSVASRRLGLWPVLTFAAIALALALGGIYGLVAYAVAQRTREVGIRMALGASRADVLRLMMRDTMRWGLVGVAIGIIGGQWLASMVASQLFEISPTDPATYVAVAVLLLGSVVLASYFPARRATSVDPMIALRYE
jgi:putative ABC transport system permease protein